MTLKRFSKNGVIGLMALAIASFSMSASAQGLFNNPSSALEAFCDYSADRRTLIYFDQSIVSTNDADWFRDIQEKITFLPAERVSYRMISRNDSRVQEIWNTCHPSLSQSDLEEARANDSVFRRGIDRQLDDARSAFNDFQNSSLAYALADNPQDTIPHYGNNDFPRKSLVEALYYDSSQYRLEGMTTRVIFFSDLVENSDLAEPDQLTDQETSYALARDAAERFPVDFHNAEFFVYGVGYTHNNSSLDRNLSDFWAMWLNKSNAQLSSFGRQLNLPEHGTTLDSASYRGAVEQDNGTQIAARLRLQVTGSGELSNSWLGVRDMRYPLEGERVCTGGNCTVRATISFADEADNFLREGDVLLLEGADTLTGSIGSEDDLELTPDGNRFALPAAFEKDSRITF